MVKLTIQQAQTYIHSTESMVRQLEINTFSLNDLYNPIFYHEEIMTTKQAQVGKVLGYLCFKLLTY